MKIGIVGWKVGGNSFGVTVPYLEYLRGFGEPVTLYPWSNPEEHRDLSLVVLPGGPDINPNDYGQQPGLALSNSCPYRAHFDKNQLPAYIELGIPIFGICRGMQAIAVHFGSILYQDIAHETSSPEKRWELVHSVLLNSEVASLLNLPLTKKQEYKVNSLHHQLVDERSLPANLRAVGHNNACGWGGVEVIAHTTLPIAGVQYHPEEMGTCRIADSIIERFLSNGQTIFHEELIEEQQIIA